MPSTESGRDVHEVLNRILAEFEAQHQDSERTVRLFEELHDLKNEEFASAIANLWSEKRWMATDAANLLLGYWAERDLAAARQWVLNLDGKIAGNFCGVLCETWARSDLSGMFQWLENHSSELPSEQHRVSAAFQLAKAAWRLDPERGIQLVRKMEPDGAHLWNLYHQWAEHDPAAASVRLLRETDEKIRERTIPAIVSAWAPRDPLAAKAWAETIPDPLVAGKTVTYVGSVLGWRNPRAGAEYLVQIPQTNVTRDALKQTVGNWAERDLDGALSWAAGLKDAPLGEWVVSAMAEKLPPDQRVNAEQRWRELRKTTQSGIQN